MSAHVPRFGPGEIALRHRVDRLSLLVSAARTAMVPGSLGDRVVRLSYPGVLDGLDAMDKARAIAKRFRGEMTQSCLAENEAAASLYLVHVDVCEDVLRPLVAARA